MAKINFKEINPFKGDKEKLAKMNFRQKVDYIWTYYKFPILITLLVAVLAVSFIKAQLAYNPDAMTLVISEGYTEDSVTAYDSINADLRNFIQLAEDEKDPLSVDDTIRFSDDSSNGAIMIQKFTALVMSGAADVMVAPEEIITYYGSQWMYCNLEDVLPAELIEELKAKDMLVEATYVPDEDEKADGAVEETFYCGIRLGEGNYFEQKGVTMDKMTMAVIISGEHQPLGLDFIDMVLGRPYEASAEESSKN